MPDKKSSDTGQHPMVNSVQRAKRRGITLLAVLVTAVSLVLVIGATVDLEDRLPAATPTISPSKSQPTMSSGISAMSSGISGISGVLRQAGAAAGDQPGGWPAASYWHSVSSYRKGSGPLVRREVWAGHHAIGGLLDSRLSSAVIPLKDGRFAGFGWDELYALPTESLALESRLRDTRLDGMRDADTELFALVGDLLRESPAPPALRRALWEVVARVPGVSLVGALKDSTGQPGVAIERGEHGYVLDPVSGRLLEECIGPKPVSDSPGGASWRATYLEQGPAVTAPATSASPTDAPATTRTEFGAKPRPPSDPVGVFDWPGSVSAPLAGGNRAADLTWDTGRKSNPKHSDPLIVATAPVLAE